MSNNILNQLDIDCIQPKTSLLWIILGLRIGLFSLELGTEIWSHSLSLLAGVGHLFADATGALSALVAASAIYWFDWLWADAAASLLVVLIISFSALSLIRSAWQMLRQDSSYLPPKTTVL